MQFLKSKAKAKHEEKAQNCETVENSKASPEPPAIAMSTGVIVAPTASSRGSPPQSRPSFKKESPKSPSSIGEIDLSQYSMPSPEFRMDSPTQQSIASRGKDTPLTEQYNYLRGELESDTVMFMENGAFYELYQEDSTFGGDFLELKVVQKSFGMAMAGVPMVESEFFLKRALEAKRRVCIVDEFDEKDLEFGIQSRRIVEMMSPGLLQNPVYLTSSHYGFVYVGEGHIVFIDLLRRAFIRLDFEDENELCQYFIKFEPAEVLTSIEKYLEVGKLYCQFVRCCNDEYFKCEGEEINYPSFEPLLKSYLKYMRIPELEEITFETPILQKRVTLESCTVHSLNLIDTERFSLLSVINLTKTKMAAKMLENLIVEPYIDRETIIFLQNSARRINELEEYEASKLEERLGGIEDMYQLICYLRGIKNVRVSPIAQLIKSVQKTVSFMEYVRDKKLFEIEEKHIAAIRSINQLLSSFFQEFEIEEKTIQLSKQNQQLMDLELRHKGLATKMCDYLRSLKLVDYIPTPFVTKSTSGPEASSIFGFTELPNRVLVVGRQIIRSDSEFKQIVESRGLKFISSTKSLYKFSMEPDIRADEDKLLAEKNELLLNCLREFFAQANIEEVECTEEFIAEADLIICAAILPFKYEEIRWCFPIIEPAAVQPHISFENAYHPIMLTSFFRREYRPETYDLSRETILSGPNMSGKSTFLRLIGVLAILAQIGFPVPAEQCRTCAFTNVLCRIGGSSLSKINSTFYTECVETAGIFGEMNDRTLLLIDELGRGTDQQAGDAIIQAAALELMQRKVPSIIATHSESVKILADVVGIENINLRCEMGKGQVDFEYHVSFGGAQSLGVEIAEQAGLHPEVVERSRSLRNEMVECERRALLANIHQLLAE